jgi:YfiH family protein
MSEPRRLTVPAWRPIPGLLHGFLGRCGGVSQGGFSSLNLSERVGDAPTAVAENRRRVEAGWPPGHRLVSMQQEHGRRVVPVCSTAEDVGAADAMVTAQAGLVLGILTADCVPILLVAPEQYAVAAVHAGWRGTLAGIVIEAIDALRERYGAPPSGIQAALGPAIGGCCYEVEREIGAEYVARWGGLPDAVWRADGPKGLLDLRGANVQQLRRAGVPDSGLYRMGPCTLCGSEDYFSHRGSGGRTGRQLSFVGWAV